MRDRRHYVITPRDDHPIENKACEPIPLADQGGAGLYLAYALTSTGDVWPWIAVDGGPMVVEPDPWPAHEHAAKLYSDVYRRVWTTGHPCGALTATTGRPCRRIVLDGGRCPAHRSTDT